MSMEICVLSEAELNSISDWQRAIDVEGSTLRLAGDLPLKEVSGYLPANLRDEQTGFECYHVDAREMMETYDNIKFDRAWKYALVLVWGGNLTEMRAAWMAGAAYARATSGIIFDPQASRLFRPSEALDQFER